MNLANHLGDLIRQLLSRVGLVGSLVVSMTPAASLACHESVAPVQEPAWALTAVQPPLDARRKHALVELERAEKTWSRLQHDGSRAAHEYVESLTAVLAPYKDRDMTYDDVARLAVELSGLWNVLRGQAEGTETAAALHGLEPIEPAEQRVDEGLAARRRVRDMVLRWTREHEDDEPDWDPEQFTRLSVRSADADEPE